jgi:hypothetical protein
MKITREQAADALKTLRQFGMQGYKGASEHVPDGMALGYAMWSLTGDTRQLVRAAAESYELDNQHGMSTLMDQIKLKA